VSINSFPDYNHLLQENYLEYEKFFFKCNSTQEVFFTTHQYTSACAPVCIPRSFLVIDVCNQGKNLCSPCIIIAQYNCYTSNKCLLEECNKEENMDVTGTPAASCLTLRRLMSYIYGAPILDVSRSHTTTQHSR